MVSKVRHDVNCKTWGFCDNLNFRKLSLAYFLKYLARNLLLQPRNVSRNLPRGFFRSSKFGRNVISQEKVGAGGLSCGVDERGAELK